MRNAKLALIFLALFVAPIALGATTTGLPWESPLSTIGNSLTGPVAGVISLVSIAMCGIAAAIGQDFSGFVKTLIGIVFIISVILGAASLIRILFGSTGAVLNPVAIERLQEESP